VGIGKSSVVPDQLLSRIGDVGAPGGQEVERRGDAGGGRLSVRATGLLAGVVDHLRGIRAIAQAIEGDRGVNHVAGQAPPRLVVVGIDPLSLED
jgi:hypothetical protein